MGCDIHIVLERRNEKRGEWVGVQTFTGYKKTLFDNRFPKAAEGEYDSPWIWFKLRRRDYSFFNALCGVRGDGSEFGYTSRGLPENASSLSQYRLSEDDPDLHSHSWLNMKELSGPLAAHKAEANELAALVAERMGNAGFNLALLQSHVSDDIEPENIDEWRLVFAFDN